jgi:hypothetical protein
MSRAIVEPRLRIEPTTGWRADAATITASLRAHPRLLIPGAIGFALRGGILLLVVPILILPTSVEVRLLLGSNIGSGGLEPGFYVLITVLSALTLVVAMAVLYVIARCELASYTRFANAPRRLTEDERSSAISRLFVVEALAMLAILTAAIPLASALGHATLTQILFPSSDASLYVRILNDVTAPLAGWLVAIVLVEVVSAVATRRVLAGAFTLRPYFRLFRHPLRVVAVGVVGWLLFIGAGVLMYAGLSLCWSAVESVFLSTGLSSKPAELIGALVVALALGFAFAAALFLGGIVSAVRAGLWTLASLR